MNKTIISMAILASASSAFALIGPGGHPGPQPKNYCLNLSESSQGVAYVGSCDQTAANQRYHLQLNENGCANGQASLRSVRIVIPSCPTFVQL